MKSDRRLVRGDLQDERLGLRRKLGPPRARDENSSFVPNPQLKRRDRDFAVTDRIRDPLRRDRPGFRHHAPERLPDGLAPRRSEGLGRPDRLDRRTVDRGVDSEIGEIQAQQAQQGVEQGTHDLNGFAATPDARKGQNADQIADAALKALDLVSRLFIGHCRRAARRPRSSRKNSSGGTKNGFP